MIYRSILIKVLIITLFLSISLVYAQNQAIVAWGRDNYGQITDVPEGSDFIAIAAKGDHSLALRQNGSLVAWGLNTNGQCNVPAGNNYVSIATGNFHSLAIRDDGTIAAWGRDNENQVSGVPTFNDFTEVSGGYYHCAALRGNGTIVGWGANSYGQSNPPAGNDFVAVAAGGFHNIALRENGTIIAWGRNWNGVLNVPAGNDFVQISAGYYQNIALRDNGTVVVWGSNEYGQVANTPTTDDFIAVSTGLGHSMALRDDGSVTCWGAGEEGQSGLFDYGQSIDPDGNDFVSIAAGRVHSVALIMTEPPSEYTLTMEVEGNGTTDPEPGDHVYDVGLEVLITAIPDDDWLFGRWFINGEEFFENPYTVTMNTNIIALAVFVYEEPFLPPPLNLTATAGDSVVHLEWEFPDLPVSYIRQDLQGFNVYRDSELLNTEPISEIFYDDHEVVNGITYIYYVTAVYIEGESEPSNTVEATPQELFLPPPSNLSFQVLDYSSVSLNWSEPDYEPSELSLLGYNIYRDNVIVNPAPVVETNYLDCGLEPDLPYTYFVTAIYNEGESDPSEMVEVYVTSVGEDTITYHTRLNRNYPNPFNPETTISFFIAEPGYTKIEVFNLTGQKITTLVDSFLEAGEHSIIWDGRNYNSEIVSSGIYMYRMIQGNYSTTKKMLLMK
ncbi:MAG: T9SS type A sorting domain-containing protein [Candidatus Cloacimonetes bacterium]|nr:T9SS type A sorting domain-containing protein [Candidatus Cloacimonadota bacterium]